MLTQEQYYKPPLQTIFEDIKKNAIKIWETYDDEYGYATEKIAQIKDLENISDNAAYMVAMFDQQNQMKLFHSINDAFTLLWLSALLNPFEEIPVDNLLLQEK